MAQTPLFELIIPCFNEAASLESLIHLSVKGAVELGLTPRSFCLILVDNGSQDQTKAILSHLKETKWGEWFKVVALDENQGYGGGIHQGLKASVAPWVGFTHADLQCDPKDAIQAFLRYEDEPGATIIHGVRKRRSFFDFFVSRIYELFVGVFWGFWEFDINAQPKVFRRELIDQIKNPPSGISFDAFVLWTAKKKGFSKKREVVFLSPRPHSVSHWNRGFLKRVETYLKVITELRAIRSFT